MRMSEMTDAYVKLDKVSKIYGTKEVKIVAVDEISFEIAKGEFVVIVGPSGAGKTTVLNILGGMDQATSGEVLVKSLFLGIHIFYLSDEAAIPENAALLFPVHIL